MHKKSQSNEIAISVKNVYKSFKIPHEKHTSLKSAVFNIFNKRSYSEYKAADGISFEVKKGEFFGIIGRNGCGKSTMLKMLAGIYQPDSGEIIVNGRLSPFLELGVGFNPDLSARDNVYLNGAILGLTRKEIDERFDDIIAFAELEQFIDQKLKNFSSGMQVRLAFSVAIQAHAEILLVDEVLAVGDERFQQKCTQEFKRLKEEGRTIVFVSHSMDSINQFCDRVMLLEGAKIYSSGDPSRVTDDYLILNENNQLSVEGSNKVILENIEKKITLNKATIFFDLYSKNEKRKINFVFSLLKNGHPVYIKDFYEKEGYLSVDAAKSTRLALTLSLENLCRGNYSVNYRIYGKTLGDIYQRGIDVTSIHIKKGSECEGICNLGASLGLSKGV
jgi:ABC-type polysaccharide/polyol phosphate transport system ATPase subunit